MNKIYLWALLCLCSCYAVAQSPSSSFKVCGYITNWADNSSVQYDKLTHAFFSFLKPEPGGELQEFNATQEDALKTYLLACKKSNCKKIISLGGGGDEHFPTMAANATSRKNFIHNVVKFCKDYGFDGADVDWELMDDANKRTNYTLLLKELKIALKKENLLLVATIGFGNYWCQWIENEALQQADWIQIMIYDQTGTWEESPYGNHASMAHFEEAQKYWASRGFKPENIVLGLPFYGYRFANKKGGSATLQSYAQIVTDFPDLTDQADETPAGDMCFFNGVQTIYQKTLQAIQKGYGGVMVWEMSQDVQGKKSLHQAILKAVADSKK